MKRGTKRRLAGALGFVILLALVAPFAVFAVPEVVGADDSFVVLSGSMEPSMSGGDVVIVEAVRPRNIRSGDVITFGRDGEVPTTHRVVERVRDADGLGFRTMGDANEDADAGIVRPDAVIGRVAFVIPYIGFVVLFASTTVGMVALIVVPIALLVITEVWRLMDARRGRRSELPIPAIRRIDDGDDVTGTAATATGDRDAASGREDAPAPRPRGGSAGSRAGASAPVYGVKTLDLGLTFVMLMVLAAYSGWMLYTDIRVESAMVLAGAVVALLLVVATWVLAMRAAGSPSGTEPEADADAAADDADPDPDDADADGNDADDTDEAPDDGPEAVTPAPRRGRLSTTRAATVRPDRDPVAEGTDD